jgi:NAD(P)-dependent dehydrogenase (short-subunit alcohol dehydrogenase family)
VSYAELAAAQELWQIQPPVDLLRDKVILITGAGAGLGRAAARTFAHYGAQVILLGRTRTHLEAVFDQISATTETQPVIVPCDLAHLGEDNCAALLDSIEDAYGRLDGILHNASFLGSLTPIAAYSIATWREAFEVNVHAPMLLTRTLIPLLDATATKTKQPTSIIFTSSSVGRVGRAFWGAYSASKFALEGLMQILADETETGGRIRVNSLNPGGTRTTMRATAYPAEDPSTLPTPESRMDIYLYLMSALGAHRHGEALDTREWAP